MFHFKAINGDIYSDIHGDMVIHCDMVIYKVIYMVIHMVIYMVYMVKFRYAERDHEQLVALCRQRAVMGQKLAKRSSQGRVVEKRALEPGNAVAGSPQLEAIQVFVEMPTTPKRTIVLMVRPSTTVREMKEVVQSKGRGISVQRLRTRGGKCLWKDELTLAEYGIGKETTLNCF